MSTLRKLRLALLVQLKELRELEKEEIKNERLKKFQSLKKRKASEIKISGLGLYHLGADLSSDSLKTYTEYRKFCVDFEDALITLKKYYQSNNHENLIRELMPLIEQDSDHITKLLQANDFKKTYYSDL